MWLFLLLVAVVAAFSTQAMAVDVKISGEYYAAGMYQDKTSVVKDDGTSTAFYFQRLRMNTVFVVSPGLTLTSRMDVMERAWGATRTVGGVDANSAATRSENENIAMDLLYVTYTSPIGAFVAGYQIDGVWGTVFADNANVLGKIGYRYQTDKLMFVLQTGKNVENSSWASYPATASDRDSSFVTAIARYAWKTGSVGLLGKYIRNATTRGADYTGHLYLLLPYAKAQVGPVALQGEIVYGFGKARKYETDTADRNVNQLAAWIDAQADFGMFYAGGSVAYLSGDDPASDDVEGGAGNNGGREWNPCLIMFNYDRTFWAGNIAGYDTTAQSGPMTNAYFAQIRGGVKPIDKVDVMMSLSWAHADKTLATQWESREYGYEVDLTATYKITNNLSYMLGGAYWFVGDWYKGTSSTGHDINNNYLLINKLTLTF